jgi:hypothetical protein
MSEEQEQDGEGPKEQDERARRRSEAQERRRPAAVEPDDALPPVKRQFEFSAAHNPKFARLAAIMSIVGIIEVIITTLGAGGWLLLVLGLPAIGSVLFLYLVPIAVPAAIGVWTLRAGQRFRLIATTKGSDVGHLMAAIDELTKLYVLQLVLFLVSIGFFLFLVGVQLLTGHAG